jgi:hypothetical protein
VWQHLLTCGNPKPSVGLTKQTPEMPQSNTDVTCAAIQTGVEKSSEPKQLEDCSQNQTLSAGQSKEHLEEMEVEASLESKPSGQLLPTEPLFTSHLGNHSPVMNGDCRSVIANAPRKNVTSQQPSECSKCGIIFESGKRLRQHNLQMHVQRPLTKGPCIVESPVT